MSRTREVFPTDMVAHLWANGSQEHARVPGGNFYFNGPALYSYGSHYVVGFRYVRRNGSVFFLLNATSPSKTTSKHRAAAIHAVPASAEMYFVDGLRGRTFDTHERAELLGAILRQAGELYRLAAEVSRRSYVRDAHVRNASERLAAARAIADAILSDDRTSRAARTAARQALKVVDAVPAWVEDRSNAEEVAAATAAVAVLMREEMRAQMGQAAERAASAYETAADEGNGILYRADVARSAVANVERVRSLAKAYRFRAPKLPNAAALLAAIEPEETAARIRELQASARHQMEQIETGAREGEAYRIRSGLLYLERSETLAVALGRPDIVPAAWLARARHLSARAERTKVIEGAARTLDMVARYIVQGDSYLNGSYNRDAVREYKRAIAALVELDASVPPTHQLGRRLAAMAPDRERIAAVVAVEEELIRAEHAQRIQEWRDGATSYPYSLRHLGPMLRISKDGRSIETSWGAQVPASVAPRLWSLILAAKNGDAVAVSEGARGMRVGHFTLDAIRSDGSLVVGCHELAYSEVEGCARALGIFTAETTEVVS